MAVPRSQTGFEAAVEAEIRRVGEDLWRRARGRDPSFYTFDFWQGRLLDWAMRDPAFKVNLFRLIDVLPTLKDTDQISAHVREYLLDPGHDLPGLVSTAIQQAAGGIGRGVAVRALKNSVAQFANQFIAGHDAASAFKVLEHLRNERFAFTVDILGEATLSNAEADVYQKKYLALVRELASRTAQWPRDDTLERDHLGDLPRANVSLKISALAPFLNPAAPEHSVARVKERLIPILFEAKQAGVFINFDLEQWELHGITYDLFEAVAADPAFADWPHLGIVVQAYLQSAPEDLHRLRRLAERRGAPITVRLVKGAYWDVEIVRSRLYGYPCPVFHQKSETDRQFERLTTELFTARDLLRPAIGTHNLRSIAHAIAQARRLGVPDHAYEFQMLYGMAEPERAALRDIGRRVRLYVPLGELLPGMAYLVRRLLENTANTSFLRLGHYEKKSLDELLQKPEVSPGPSAKPPKTFENCPLTDFTNAVNRSAFQRAVDNLLAALPLHVPVVVSGSERATATVLKRECPNDTKLLVSHVSAADAASVDDAAAAAFAAWPNWRATPAAERAAVLRHLADLLEHHRAALAALESVEVAKPWAEADADVAEAIDFCRYYALQAENDLGPRPLRSVSGEENTVLYEGRGPTAVIAPWNFPAAIFTGMSVAALVAGNPVLLKPAEQSSAIAWRIYRLMREAGVPDDVAHFLPGAGEAVGARLVDHPKVLQIAFTGSKAVGLAILALAAKVRPGQLEVKHVVCEMGGKNAIIVDEDADLDEAVSGVVKSAFGYAGQKCSACSRVIVVGSAAGPFERRLVEAAKSLIIAPAHLPHCQLPPVVDREAFDRLTQVIESPGPGAEPLYIGRGGEGGYFVPPAIFRVTDLEHRLMQEELFGPVLAVYRVNTFDEALDAANATEFALTGGVYSRTPSHLEAARARFRVGNLYLNRPVTGALVDRQPFGGFHMSGLGTKAGGPGYVLNFCVPRVITENTTRRGFTPDVSH